jgi:WD40 repeat protein
MAFTVTATQGGSTGNGMILRVMVLTQAAATQNGATANTNFASLTNTHTLSITTTQTGSRVYGAIEWSSNSAATAAALTTLIDDVADATNQDEYVTFKATSLTGTPGATTLGATSAGTATGPFAMAEIKTAGTLTEDASGPAVASTTTATAVTTASFTPPGGSLLVALVSSDGGAGTCTMALSDTSGLGLSWVEQVKNNAADYAGVWIAQMPSAATSGPALAPQFMGSRPVTVATNAGWRGAQHSR